jgi:REP element-mobilizing transposase RayT
MASERFGVKWLFWKDFQGFNKIEIDMEIFEEEQVYHIYNRSNGKEKLFRDTRNYHFFLLKYANYINPIANTYALCLIPNHFHAMVKIKSLDLINQNRQKRNMVNVDNFSSFISKKWANFFSSYTQSYNKFYERSGNLFNASFKRKKVENPDYYTALAIYIHQNPIKHKLVRDLKDWPFNSYLNYINGSPITELDAIIDKDPLIEWFGSIKHFEAIHQQFRDIQSTFD